MFPSQWQRCGDVFIANKHTVGNREWHYRTDTLVRRLPEKNNWVVPQHIDTNTVDFSWHPDSLDPPYVYHFPSQHQSACGLVYEVPGSTSIKLVDAFVAVALPSQDNWLIPDYVVAESVDFSWHPNVLDTPCNYHFNTKWHWDKVGGPVYCTPGASDIKYLDLFEADTLSDSVNWYIPDWIDPGSIDWSWVPNPADPAYIYEFAVEWGWDNIGGPEYHVPGATKRKYVEFFVARTKPDTTNFTLNDSVAADDDILRWRPNPAEPPYIYVFGNQWYPGEIRESARYTVPGASQVKFIESLRAKRLPDTANYTTLVESDFDYSWEPDPGDPPYIYVFGNQHWPAEIMPTVEYHVPGATERKFIEEPRATLAPTTEHWATITDLHFDFDYSWCPDPGDPAYNYVFGNQWYPAEEMPTVEYRMPGATESKYVDNHRAQLLPVMDRWTIPEEVNATNIDFSWVPHPKDAPYVHHFGSDYQMSTGLTYTAPGATEPKFEGEPPVLSKDKRVIDVLDIFFVDHMNAMSATRFEKLKDLYPNIQKTRYMNGMMATVQRCLTKAKTRKFWVVSSENDYTDFDFAWHAEPWQGYMTHVFGSQWNKWSDTFLINKWEFERNSKWAKGIEEFPNLNFVKNQTVRASDDANNIYYVEWGNPESVAQLEQLKAKYPNIKVTRFVDNYLDTFKRIMSTATTEYVWIINSICNYSKFDFSWQPEAWQAEMIHVFASGFEKRGDTFYINVAMFKQQMVELEMLDWFNVINYCTDQHVYRWPAPHHYYTGDDLITEVKNYQFEFPYAVFSTYPEIQTAPEMCLWSKKDRIAERYTASGCVSVIPRDVKSEIRTQIYDYPYVNTQNLDYMCEDSLDIIYLSNGEPEADKWYNHLCDVLAQEDTGFPTLRYDNRVKRVDGVNGRLASAQAAANSSNTPWFFVVTGKLEVNKDFDWTWQPDYWQGPKHYIFDAVNPVNGLRYGHQAMVAWNKTLILNTTQPGLDLTMSQPHEHVPLMSGTAHFNSDPWTTWRTSFREVVKMRLFSETQPTVETSYRLKTWLNKAEGNNAEWCLRGASDAVAYYDEVAGEYTELMRSFDWDWLREYYNQKYS